MSISPQRVQEIIKTFGRSASDSGAAEVQCAILTDRIVELAQYSEKFKKDFAAKRAVVKLVAQRRRMLSYLKQKSQERYLGLIASLGLRK